MRAAAAAAGRPIAILLDFPGPKIRLGPLEGEQVTLETGATFRLRPGRSGEELPPGDGREASMGYEHLAADMRPGDRILLVDGAAELRVTGRDGDVLVTEVVRGGPIRSKGGVNVPSERLSISPLTAADRALLPLVAQIGADLVAQSFVRTAADIEEMRALLPDGPPIVAKIETRAAVEGIDAILDVVDAIMVARGDLGVEIPFEDVPIVQKELDRAGARSRPAGDRRHPDARVDDRRAPADASRGERRRECGARRRGRRHAVRANPRWVHFPIDAPSAARARIAARADAYRPRPPLPRPLARSEDDESVVEPPQSLPAAGLTGSRRSCASRAAGRPPSSLRPADRVSPILAFTPHEASARRLAVRHGIMPVVTRDPTDTDDLLELVARGRCRVGLLAPGARVAVAAASRAMLPTPNLLLVTTLPR